MGVPAGQREAQAWRLCEQAGEDASSGERLMEGRGARRRCPLKQPTTTGRGEVMVLQQRGEPRAPVLESGACRLLPAPTARARAATQRDGPARVHGPRWSRSPCSQIGSASTKPTRAPAEPEELAERAQHDEPRPGNEPRQTGGGLGSMKAAAPTPTRTQLGSARTRSSHPLPTTHPPDGPSDVTVPVAKTH